MSILPPPACTVKPLPATAAERVRELASLHRAWCRYYRAGLVCSTCHDLDANADRLEQKAAEMAARREIVEAARAR